ncbi:MAG: paraquat-inducible protein A [Pseudomonadota bacterium]
MNRRLIALIVLGLAFVCLVPGVTLPVLDLSGSVEKREVAELGKQMISGSNSLSMFGGIAERLIDSMDTDGEIGVYYQRRSILSTVRDLAITGHVLVAFLVILFSVFVPVIKGVLVVYGNVGADSPGRQRASRLANALSKWSMADVFVIAIFIAFLAARGSKDAGELVHFDATFGQGFYFFLGYCLLSIASAQLMPARTAAS